VKKGLIITYYWPPSGGSGVQRWLKFAKYMPDYGWEPIIYTPSNPDINIYDHSLEEECKGMKVIKHPIWEPYSFYKKFINFKKDKNTQINPIKNSEKSGLKERVALWIRANFFIPDPKFFWINPSYRFLKKYLRDNPVDCIISTGPPHSMHLIAKKLSKKLGIPWCADFRDPWTKIYYFKRLPMCQIVKKLQYKMESSILNNASAIITVSNTIKNDLESSINNEGKRKKIVYCITNGYDSDDFDVNYKHKDTTKKFVLTYSGLLQDSFNPDILWKNLKKLIDEDDYYKDNLLIRLIGKAESGVIDDIYHNGLSEYLEDLGYIAHKDIIHYQIESDFLILPLSKDPESKGILTGKFFEYLAAQRPIIAFGPKESDLSTLLKETNSGAIFEWDEEEQLYDYLINYKEFKPEKDKIKNYSRRELTSQLTVLLNNISNK
jgi:hypothetical protein